MARLAAQAGTHTIVATPHVHGDVDLDSLATRVAALNTELRRQEVKIDVITGAEVLVSALPGLSDSDLEKVTLGVGRAVLVESPRDDGPHDLESLLFDGLRSKNFVPVLSRPERCPLFLRRPELLGRLVHAGSLCSITRASIEGEFGSAVRRFTSHLLASGWVHNVGTDSHDPESRPPSLEWPRMRARGPNRAHWEWLTLRAPAALLAGGAMPPDPSRAKRSLRRAPAV